MDSDIWGSLGMVARPWSSSRLSCGEHLLLRCDGNAGNSFPNTQGKDPFSRATRRNQGSSGCGRDSRPSSPVLTPTLGVLLESPQESHSSSRVGACTCAFLPNCSISVMLPFSWIKGSGAFPRGFPTRILHEAFPQGCPTCHHSQSPPDVSVHCRDTCFPYTASTFKRRIDSHHGGT